MRLLVTGAGGLFGSNVAAVADGAGETVIATYHNRQPDVPVTCAQFDITNADRFEELLTDHAPDTVVNCAAMTDVDRCERKPEQARRINGDAPGTLAGIAADQGVEFIQVSTDYVFDGRSDRGYEPDDETSPIQTYGRAKLLGERRVRNRHPNPHIVRLSFVYGRNDRGDLEGFPGWFLDRLRSGESTPLFTDQHVTPTRAGAAAETVLELCQTPVAGTFHVATRNCVTPYEFGTTLAELAGEPTSILNESRMADIERAAERPRNTCLSVERTETELGRPQPTVGTDLRALL